MAGITGFKHPYTRNAEGRIMLAGWKYRVGFSAVPGIESGRDLANESWQEKTDNRQKQINRKWIRGLYAHIID
jgi:hypothetical protein